tara:strand:+ start:1484 stop:2632 length:1149 start_codon:yes stop_codon:yes gene_type:complete
MKSKVAIIDTLGAHGGSFHFYSFGQCIGLLNSGVDVRLYTNNETPNPEIKGLQFFSFYKDIFACRYRSVNGLRWIVGSIKSIFHARFSGVSIFHFHIFYTNILVLFNVLLVRLLLGKVVLTIHDVASFAKKDKSELISKSVYKLANLLLTHNEFSKSEIQISRPVLASRVFIIPHGNYTPFISIEHDKSNSRSYLGLPNERKVLLFFGMIKEVKGLEILLKSLKHVIAKNPDVMLLIAGKPWENDFVNYQNIIDRNDLTNYCVLHTRFIDHDDVAHYYCASDLVVLPYKKIYQSGVLMMALSYERPVLTSDLSPLKEVITDNKTGFLFKTEDVDSLTERLNSILSSQQLLERVRIEGSQLSNTKYNWDEIGLLTHRAYLTID